MSGIKLIYFDLYGRAELTRLLLAAGGVKYEDCRISAQAFAGPTSTGNQTAIGWPGEKDKCPYGQLPVLDVDGHRIAQSGAIQRYVATRFGLMGLCPIQHALIDATLEQIRDIADSFGKIQALPKDDQAAARSKFVAELGTSAATLESQLKNNNGGNGWIVGTNTSAADIALYRVFGMNFRGADKDAYEKHCPPLIKGLVSRVEAHPPIAAYLATRKVLPF